MLSETSTALCFVLIMLVPLAGAGLALINTGLGRSRSAAHSMMTSLIVIAIAAVVYYAVATAALGVLGAQEIGKDDVPLFKAATQAVAAFERYERWRLLLA